MSFIDDVIGIISPGWKAGRLQARYKIAAYEAVMPTRTHKARRENRNANQLTQFGGRSLREQARWLDNNHDLVIGLLDKMEERIVGARGIIVEPQPLLLTGAVADDLAKEIRAAWAEWSVAPEVTGQYTRPVMERLLARTWLRDGEVFCQMVQGKVTGLTPQAGVPFWLEALEPDFVPLDSNDSGKGLCQGIFLNAWGRPIKYQVHKSLTTSGIALGDTKEINADNMLHLKFVRRLHQIRGNSLLSGILIRLSALKDYEDAELTAARIAAALGMYVKKGDGQSYPESEDKEEREMDIVPGMLFDGLQPGEDIGMIKSDRPNPNLENFRNGQLRAVSAGSRGSYSSIARDYNGTYSSQRQELVESFEGYNILQDSFVAAISRPNYRNWLQMAITSGVIKTPADLDMKSLFNAVYSGPVMPWIDPLKEANGWKVQVRGGAATESDWIRSRGANPSEVKRRRKAEIDENNKLGLVFDTDPANDKGGTSAEATKQDESSSESERRKK
ncbi:MULTISPECIES: phage portal protein [Serratia]|uniref:Phage portal protein, lambda family n=1 Tax=Serratia quinivorans TaxID=137545 RepID=A0A380AS24_9GAMM|nr:MULTISPECIES: phage portal protein [Serratia]SUI86311.1 phage portal protein, lambda family [Serratia quinivorans]AEF46527.1 phage portal protein, lambda family [Serratia plymuthica AS9]AEF51479.1 phage portal protein, lambda family [Serratia sp. AS12]AEG29187.1 phage portal protein, lambda family [Serratia sp. AS13]RYM50978.1 phage portal protein [Serratia proteamaculans]